MMREIFVQAESAGMEIAYVQFIGTDTTMDNISQNAKARLWTLEGEREVSCGEDMTLQQVNEQAKKNDAELAGMVRNGQIDGMILLSCDPKE